jgi:hypothetical protein
VPRRGERATNADLPGPGAYDGREVRSHEGGAFGKEALATSQPLRASDTPGAPRLST